MFQLCECVSILIKLMCQFVGQDSMTPGLVKIEPNLVVIFRVFSMMLSWWYTGNFSCWGGGGRGGEKDILL